MFYVGKHIQIAIKDVITKLHSEHQGQTNPPLIEIVLQTVNVTQYNTVNFLSSSFYGESIRISRNYGSSETGLARLSCIGTKQLLKLSSETFNSH